MAVANCPSCGGPVEFTVGSSIVRVCDYCRTIVARSDRGIEDLGKVAALIDTGTPLRRDLPGKYQGIGFRITGRVQMRHQAGGTWDEWYAAFDDGRWGWLAEAAGKYYVTFTTLREGLPTYDQVEVGGRLGELIVTETGTAGVISGEGEIPWRVEPESSYDYADLSGPNGAFATIDYSEGKPLFFAGREVSLADLGLDSVTRTQKRIKVARLNCSNCGAALNLVAPDRAERIICPSCGAMHDVAEGNLKYLKVLKQKGPELKIPLGTKGTIDGTEYVIAGFMQRSVFIDEEHYYWTEYLLYNEQIGYRWLVESDNHWSFVRPIATGDVTDAEPLDAAIRVTYGGKTYKIFGNAVAKVEYVLGEFYWKVQQGEKVRAVDYVNPPEGLSKEISGFESGEPSEINWSHARYMQTAEVETAFGVKKLPRPRGVGMMQPYTGADLGKVWMILLGLLGVIALVLLVSRPRRQVLNEVYDFSSTVQQPAGGTGGWGDTTSTTTTTATATGTTSTTDTATGTTASTDTTNVAAPPQEKEHVLFTKPFRLNGYNVRVDGYAQVSNDWLYVAGDLGDPASGLLEPFDLPIEFYEGYDQGEHWTEGDKEQTVYLASLPAGEYTMRLEAQWDEKHTLPPASVHVVVTEGVFRWSHLLAAIVLLTLPPLRSMFKQRTFEVARWQESQYTSGGIFRT